MPNLGLIKLKTLNIYNKTHLKTEFIKLFKSFVKFLSYLIKS